MSWKHRHSSEGSDLTDPTSGPHQVRRETRGTMLGDRTRLLARLGGSSQKRRILPVKVLAKLPGPGYVVAARRSRPTKCQPLGQYHVRRESLGAMPGDRAWPTTGLGRVPPGDAGHYPVWSGPKLSGPGGVSTARRTRITRAEPPAYTIAHRESHGNNAGRPRMAYCRTGASPTRIRRILPDRSGLKLPDPGGVDTARMASDHQGRAPGYSMYAGSHTAQRRATGHGPLPD